MQRAKNIYPYITIMKKYGYINRVDVMAMAGEVTQQSPTPIRSMINRNYWCKGQNITKIMAKAVICTFIVCIFPFTHCQV